MNKELDRTYDLLDLAANDHFVGFKDAVLNCSANPHEFSAWYHRQYALQKMGVHAVTPTMLASMYGSLNVLKFILSHAESHRGSVMSTLCSTDKATPLHYAVAGCSPRALDTVKLLLTYGADVNAVDAYGMRPVDIVNSSYKVCAEKVEMERLLLNEIAMPSSTSLQTTMNVGAKLDHLSEPAYIDGKTSIYTSDDFRMFSFKVRQCSRAYSHDWTECPFVHNGENARRRDPRKFHYSCVPCPDFRKGACRLGDACEYAHGIFESWLHPAQYRTRLCKDGMECKRRVCFFAHAKDELRPLYISSGSAVPSPRGLCVYDVNGPHGPASSSSLCLAASPLSQLQKLQKNGSPQFCPSLKSAESSWYPPDLPTLLLPNAGSFHLSPLRVAPNGRDACMADVSLDSILKSEEGFRLDDSGACVDFSAKYDSLSMSTVNHVDCAIDMASRSPTSPTLRDRMPSLLATPKRESMWVHHNNNTRLQDHGLTRSDTLSHLPPPSQGCSPLIQHQIHSRAEMLFHERPSTTYHAASAGVVYQNVPPSGSLTKMCYVGGEMLANTHMSSTLSSSCPITCSQSHSHGFSMSDWGSPTGKLEWGVQKEDLHRLRRLSSNGRNAMECPAFCAASLNASEVEGGFKVANDESDSVLGFWLEQMQLDEITI